MSQDKQLRRFMVQHADGSRSGPLNAEALRSLAANGTIGRDDQIQQVGKDEWHAAGSIKGLSFGRDLHGDAPHLGIVDEDSTPSSQRFVESLTKQSRFSTAQFVNLSNALAADGDERPAALWVIESGWAEQKGSDRIRWLVLDQQKAEQLGLTLDALYTVVEQSIGGVQDTPQSVDQVSVEARLRNRFRALAIIMIASVLAVVILIQVLASIDDSSDLPRPVGIGMVLAVTVALLGAILSISLLLWSQARRCQQCRVPWGYKLEFVTNRSYSQSLERRRATNRIDVTSGYPGVPESFRTRSHFVTSPEEVVTETENATEVWRCRCCGHERRRRVARQYDL